MPTTSYEVYTSNGTFVATVEEYCEDQDISQSEFFKRAGTELLEKEGYL